MALVNVLNTDFYLPGSKEYGLCCVFHFEGNRIHFIKDLKFEKGKTLQFDTYGLSLVRNIFTVAFA